MRHKHLVNFSLSAWYEATGRKRPHSPAGDESARNNNVREPASKGAGTPVLWLVRYLTGCAEKRRKKERQELEEEQESDGEEIMKKSQSDVYSIPGVTNTFLFWYISYFQSSSRRPEPERRSSSDITIVISVVIMALSYCSRYLRI